MLTAVACLVLCSTYTQPAQAGSGPATWQLAHQIMLLVQVNQLRLSPQQVGAILKAYTEVGVGQEHQQQATSELERIKERLLRGEKVSWRELRDALSTVRSPVRGQQQWQLIGQLADRVMTILDEWQLALIQHSRSGWPAARRGRRDGAREADVLVALTGLQEDEWPDTRDKLAKRIAGAAGGDEQVFAAARDFLDRVHQMDEQTIRSKASELFAELQTMLPEDIYAPALLAPIDTAEVRKRLMFLLADPWLPRVLKEMAEARGWTAPAD